MFHLVLPLQGKAQAIAEVRTVGVEQAESLVSDAGGGKVLCPEVLRGQLQIAGLQLVAGVQHHEEGQDGGHQEQQQGRRSQEEIPRVAAAPPSGGCGAQPTEPLAQAQGPLGGAPPNGVINLVETKPPAAQDSIPPRPTGLNSSGSPPRCSCRCRPAGW